MFVCYPFLLSACRAPLPKPRMRLFWWGPDRVSRRLFTAAGHKSTASATPTFRCDTFRSAPAKGSSRSRMARAILAPGKLSLQIKEREEGSLIELPVVLIGIVPIYNVPEVHQELRLSGEVLAGIFLGDVKTWNAPQIVKLNPELTLPNLPIQVINRPAGKGSNYVLTDFLSKVSSKFRAQLGVTPSPEWLVGTPAERSSDMADKVKNSPGSIGYVEYQYAVKGHIPQAAVLNRAGKFVKASV